MSARKRRMDLGSEVLVADLYGVLQTMVIEQSQPARYKLSVELWELVFQIVERSTQLGAKTAREKRPKTPRTENEANAKIIAQAKRLLEGNSKRTANSAASLIYKRQRIKSRSERTIRRVLTEARIFREK